jgi:hypothetical protein
MGGWREEWAGGWAEGSVDGWAEGWVYEAYQVKNKRGKLRCLLLRRKKYFFIFMM